MAGWDRELDEACAGLVQALLDAETEAERRRSWQALVVRIAPHIEGWASGSWLLRRWRLDGEDDARAVLVAVLDRLARDDHANLRRFAQRRGLAGPDRSPELDLVQRASRIAMSTGTDELAEEVDATADQGRGGTPFRAWLLTLVRFCANDHVRRRVGWADVGEGGPTKRDFGTDARSLTGAPERSERPPVTDALTIRAFVAEVEAFCEDFPVPMRLAFEGWIEGLDYEAIAARVEADDAAAARKLVRAAQARLRHHFRGRWEQALGLA